MANTELSANGRRFIHELEGCCLKFYGDPKGYPTVGYGHLITSEVTYRKNTTGNPNDSLLTKAEVSALVKKYKLPYTSPISADKASEFFSNDVASAVETVSALSLPSGCLFSQNQFDAMVSLVYNCGPKVINTDDVQALLNSPKIFTWDTLTRSECDTCSRIVSKAFSYDKTLKNRRNKEATLFCNGKQYTHKYEVYSL